MNRYGAMRKFLANRLGRLPAWNGKVVARGVVIGAAAILFAALFLVSLAPWLVPTDSNKPSWDSALGSAAQVIGGATAVVFALLVVPIQNAATKYSPVILKHIRRDRGLWVIFGSAVASLLYCMVSLYLGAVAWRVGVAGFLTVAVILGLGVAAWWVTGLLNPMALSQMVEARAVKELSKKMAEERSRSDKARDQVEQLTGTSLAVIAGRYPVPDSVVTYLREQIQSLLSITAGGIEARQVDVVDGVSKSITNILHAYLIERGESAAENDPLMLYVSEEFLSLANAAQKLASHQTHLEVIKALGRLADSGVAVSTPGIGLGERNVALMPIGYLHMIATSNLTNFTSAAAAAATTEIGRVAYQLLQKGLPAFATGVVSENLSEIMLPSLQPQCYHIAAIGAKSLMDLWPVASAKPGGRMVRRAIVDAIASVLKSYREEPATMESRMAIGELVSPAAFRMGFDGGPIGAAVAKGLLQTPWPPDSDLLEDIKRLGDPLVRYLVWRWNRPEFQDILSARWATEQAVELTVLLSAIATGNLILPGVPGTPVRGNLRTTYLEKEAAEAWFCLTGIQVGACTGLTETESYRIVDWRAWDIPSLALSGACASILAALINLENGASEVLETQLGKVLDDFYTSAESMLEKWDEVLETNPVIQHVRLIGMWLLRARRLMWSRRAARIVARADTPTWRDRMMYGDTDSRYPIEPPSDRWRPQLISPIGQTIAPHYLQEEAAFNTHENTERFERLVDRARGLARIRRS